MRSLKKRRKALFLASDSRFSSHCVLLGGANRHVFRLLDALSFFALAYEIANAMNHKGFVEVQVVFIRLFQYLAWKLLWVTPRLSRLGIKRRFN